MSKQNHYYALWSVVTYGVLWMNFFCIPQLCLWGSPLWVRILHMWLFFNPTIVVVTFCLHGFMSEQNLSYALWSVVCGVLWENKTFAIHWGYAVVMMFYDWTKALLYIVGWQWLVVNKHHGSIGSHGVLWMYESLVACLRLQAHNFQWKYKRILYWKMCENSI